MHRPSTFVWMIRNSYIGRYGPVDWPAKSLDINPLELFLWAFAKDQVYRASVYTLSQLKLRITTEIRTVSLKVLNNFWLNLKNRSGSVIGLFSGIEPQWYWIKPFFGWVLLMQCRVGCHTFLTMRYNKDSNAIWILKTPCTFDINQNVCETQDRQQFIVTTGNTLTRRLNLASETITRRERCWTELWCFPKTFLSPQVQCSKTSEN